MTSYSRLLPQSSATVTEQCLPWAVDLQPHSEIPKQLHEQAQCYERLRFPRETTIFGPSEIRNSLTHKQEILKNWLFIKINWLAKFHQNSSARGRSAHERNIHVPCQCMPTLLQLSSAHAQVTILNRFSRTMAHSMRLRIRKCLWDLSTNNFLGGNFFPKPPKFRHRLDNISLLMLPYVNSETVTR
jgi:hypothetical protein